MDTRPLPTSFVPDLPVTERVARFLLAQSAPRLHFELVEPNAVRRAVSAYFAGHTLQDALERRQEMLDHETARVQLVRDYLIQATGLAALALVESGG